MLLLMLKRLVEYHFDFDVYWNNDAGAMVLHIVLGNQEYIINVENDYELDLLWKEIELYWLSDRKSSC